MKQNIGKILKNLNEARWIIALVAILAGQFLNNQKLVEFGEQMAKRPTEVVSVNKPVIYREPVTPRVQVKPIPEEKPKFRIQGIFKRRNR